MPEKAIVSCKAARTGLSPFINQTGAFRSMDCGMAHFLKEIVRHLQDGNLHLFCTKENGTAFEFEICHPTGKICGTGIIEEVEA